MKEDKEYIEDEIRTEFQLERMILFSDAVFAIVITLMAIEIHIPEGAEKLPDEVLLHHIKHLFPVILAYIISFFFVGFTWYQHLKLFSYLKDYDKGVVIRNLVMLFFIGFFPFSVSIITRGQPSALLPMSIYFGTIICCRVAQLTLTHYILYKRPQLCIRAEMIDVKKNYVISRNTIMGLTAVFILIVITRYFIKEPGVKSNAFLWILIFPLYIRLMKRKIEKSMQQ